MDLWQGAAGHSTAERAHVWATVYKDAPTRSTKPGGQPPPSPDVSIDDPAVSGFLVELIPLLAESVLPTTGPTPFVPIAIPVPRLPAPLPGAIIPTVQSRSLAVSVQVASSRTQKASDGPDPAAARLSVVGQLATVIVAEQEIWELRVYPMVPSANFAPSSAPGAQRFNEAFGLDRPVVSAFGADQRLFPPWRVVIEGATSTAVLADPVAAGSSEPDPSVEFYGSISPAFAPATGVVTVTFARLDPLGPRRYRYVTRIDLARQVWRWEGRVVDPFPFEAANDPAARDKFPDDSSPSSTYRSPMVWDAEGFGDRSGMDLLETSVGVHVADSSVTLFREDLTNDPRALYYRVSARAINRYAPLFPLRTPATPMYAVRSAADSSRNAWKRLFVPCRFAGPLPRPSVKLVVPLTQAEAKGVTAPGLLAILDEASYHRGGLAETIEAEVVRVVYAMGGSTWPEFGPDPILRGAGFTATQTPPTPRADPLSLQIVGPVGHTFDTLVDVPRFVASTLVVQAPLAAPASGGVAGDDSLAWYFARVRFRRLLLREAMAGYPDTTNMVNFPAGLAATVPLSLVPTGDTAITLVGVTVAPRASDTGDGTLTASVGTRQATATFGLAGLTLGVADSGVVLSTENFAFDPASAPTPITLDLRIIFQRDPAPSAGASAATLALVAWHVSFSARVRSIAPAAPDMTSPILGAWQLLEASAWPVGTKLPTGLALSWTGPQPPPSFPVDVVPALVSPFTPPVWSQFLPDSNALIPAEVRNNPAASGVGWSRATGTNELLLRFLLRDATGVFQDHDWGCGPAPTVEGSLSRFTYQVLLTEPVLDVQGRPGQERYLGLYGFGDPDSTHLHNLHTSPVLDSSEDIQGILEVRVRVMELQANSRVLGGSPPSGEAAWSVLFGPAKAADPTRSDDAKSRIVRVSQPVDLQRKVGPV